MFEFFSIRLSVTTLLILVVFSLCKAQDVEKPEDEIPLQKKERKKLKFSFVRVGTEMIHIFSSAFGGDLNGYEINADAGFNNRYFLVVDLGTERYTRDNNDGNYEYVSNGQYLRVGFDYNLLYKKTALEALSFGLRYGNSSFKHKFTYTLFDDFWSQGGTSNSFEETQLNGAWIEFVMAFKVELIKNFYLSPNFRIKFLNNQSETQFINIADIPGYGNTKSNTRFNVNYSLIYKLPFGSKK